MPREKGRTLVAQNKRARHDYSVEDVYEAGLVLTGTEVKSLRAGRASLTDGYATIEGGAAGLRGVHIAEYTQGTWTNHEPRRARKLLLHREELRRIAGKVADSGVTLVPLSLYFKDGYAKVDLAVARGQVARFAQSTRSEIAAHFIALRDTRERMRHDLATDDEHPLVAQLDVRDEALRHDRARPVFPEHFDTRSQVASVRADAEIERVVDAAQRQQVVQRRVGPAPARGVQIALPEHGAAAAEAQVPEALPVFAQAFGKGIGQLHRVAVAEHRPGGPAAEIRAAAGRRGESR